MTEGERETLPPGPSAESAPDDPAPGEPAPDESASEAPPPGDPLPPRRSGPPPLPPIGAISAADDIPQAEVYIAPAQPLTPEEAERYDAAQPPSELEMLAAVTTETVRLPVRRKQATLPLRIGALGLDIVFIVMLLLVIICVMAIFVRGLDWFDDRQILLILLVIYPIYSLAEVRGPATVGKVIFGIHVTAADGSPSTQAARLRRWPMRNLPLFLLGIGLAIPAVWSGPQETLAGMPVEQWKLLLAIAAGTLAATDLLPALSPGGRSLHERLSGTAVYRDIGGVVQFARVDVTDEELSAAAPATEPAAGDAADGAPDVGEEVAEADEMSEPEAAEDWPAADEGVREDELASLSSASAVAAGRRIRPAVFSKRLIATVLDFGILVLLSFTIVPILMVIVASVSPISGPYLMVVPAMVLAAYVGCEVWASASPGKFLVGLRITRADTYPSNAGFRLVRAIIKNLPMIIGVALATTLFLDDNGWIKLGQIAIDALTHVARWISAAGGVFYLIGCLFVLFPGRRALHDMLSGTAVYEDIDLSSSRVHGPASPTPFEITVSHRAGML